jgi:Zn-dependent protease
LNKSQLLILMIPVVIFSLTVHEYSHGRIAFLLGDNTAKRLGRLSFNPLKHLDPIGTLFFYFMGFGWAKPVPVDPRNFDQPRRDMMYVAIAGPLSNLALAVICGFFIRIIDPYDSWILFTLLSFGVYINVALAIFNLLPVFPLDGSSVIKGLVPFNIAEHLIGLDRFGAFLLIGVVLLDHFANTGILGVILWVPIITGVQFLSQDAFPDIYNVLRISFSTISG